MARNVRMVVADPRRCLGCKSCEIQCAMAHCEARTLEEAMHMDSPPQARVHVEAAGQYGMPIQCQHCEDAPCVAICPTGAIAMGPDEQPPVLLDRDRCIGCRFCVLVCPFGVIDLSRDGKAMIKCDLCIQRTKAGEEPACVAACPTGALQFKELDEDVRRRRREAALSLAGGPDAEGGKGPGRP